MKRSSLLAVPMTFLLAACGGTEELPETTASSSTTETSTTEVTTTEMSTTEMSTTEMATTEVTTTEVSTTEVSTTDMPTTDTTGSTSSTTMAPDMGMPCNGPPGLYVAGQCDEVAGTLRFFQPRHVLWTDDLEKERWIYLPNEDIDTTDPNNWVFPQLTRVFKNFIEDGLILETRVFEKTGVGAGPDSWTMRTFMWNREQTGVTEVFDGAENVLGTDHDIPSIEQCHQCHSFEPMGNWAEHSRTNRDVLLGFTALQLNHDLDGLNLADLNAEGHLSQSINLADAEFPGTADEQAAQGYLHANCGHCHGADDGCQSPFNEPGCDRAAGGEMGVMGLRMRGRIGLTDITQTDLYQTAVDQMGSYTIMDSAIRISSTNAMASTVAARIQSRMGGMAMPPLGTEEVDEDGIMPVLAWIESLSAP